MNKYKFSKRAMSLIASAMTLGISFNSMANPNSKSTLVKSEEYNAEYASFTLEDYELAKKKNVLVYRLLDNSVVFWDMKPCMSLVNKQKFKCDASVEIPLHPVVQRSQTAWWKTHKRDIQCFYLPSIDNPEESYLIRCEYDGTEDIEWGYATCGKSRCYDSRKGNPLVWHLLKNPDGKKANPKNEEGISICTFPTKVLASYLPKADNNVINEIKQIGFAGYNDKSSAYKYVFGGGAMLILFPFLREN